MAGLTTESGNDLKKDKVEGFKFVVSIIIAVSTIVISS
jgi:hypothetical protein